MSAPAPAPTPPGSYSPPPPPGSYTQGTPPGLLPGSPPAYAQPGPGAPGGAYLPIVQQAGIVPLRPLTLSDILTGSFNLLKFSPRTSIGFSLLCQLAVMAIVLPLAAWGLSTAASSFDDNSPEAGAIGGAFGGVASLPSSFVAKIVALVLCVVVSRAVIGERISLGQAWREARPSFWHYIGLGLLYGLCSLLAAAIGYGAYRATGAWELVILLALIALPIAFWLSVRLTLAPTALVLERTTMVGALRRSWALTHEQFWRIFGIQLVVGLVVGLAAGAISFPISMIGTFVGMASGTGDAASTLPIGSLITNLGGQLLGNAVMAPVSVASGTLLYLDQRMRREGLDVQLAQVVQQRLEAER